MDSKAEKKFYKEMMKIGVDALVFYSLSRTKLWKKDVRNKALTRQGDLLARDIFVLINNRVAPSPAGLVVAMIAIMQTFNYLMQSLPSGIYKGLSGMLNSFRVFFGQDGWRWVKHDHMQVGYDFFFGGHKVDGDRFKETIDNMLAHEDSNNFIKKEVE